MGFHDRACGVDLFGLDNLISEASLSFPGVGVPPGFPTWGSMLADGREHISTSWRLAFFPGLCIFTIVLGIDLLGDALRAILDPG